MRGAGDTLGARIPQEGRRLNLFERFTDRARRVLVTAQQYAVEDGQFICADHIVSGLLDVAGGMAEVALTEAGVTQEAVRAATLQRRPAKQNVTPKDALSSIGIDLDAVKAAVGDASIVMPAADVPAFAPESKKILEDMLRAAIGLQHNYIGTEHMLLAVLGTENSGLAVLRDLGVAPESLDERVHALIADATDASG